MAITLKWRNGEEEVIEGRTITHDGTCLFVFGSRFEGYVQEEPVRVIELDQLVWARSEDGELVIGHAELEAVNKSN